MFKFISSALLAGSFAMSSVPQASACDGGLCCHKKNCTTAPGAACAAPAAAPAASAATPDMQGMPDMPPTPPSTAQNTRSQYRSYSYAPAPAYRAPVTRSYGGYNTGGQGQFRADHKIRGY